MAEENSIFEILNARVNIVDYAAYLGYHPVQQGNYYTLQEHDSVKIKPSENTYRRYSTDEGGDIVDFTMNMLQISKGSAIKQLKQYCGLDKDNSLPAPVSYKPPKLYKPIEKKPFILPSATDNSYKRIYAYLCKTRGIDQECITDLIKRKMLFEESKHHNACFIGYDYDGVAKYGFLKGTTTEKPFAIDIAGNDKKVAIYIDNKSPSLVIGEAIIDIMSVMTITKINGGDFNSHNYLSMQGNNIESVKYHLSHHPELTQIVIAVDNDDTGEKYRAKIIQHLKDIKFTGKVYNRRPKLNDFNDELKKIKGLLKSKTIEKECEI